MIRRWETKPLNMPDTRPCIFCNAIIDQAFGILTVNRSLGFGLIGIGCVACDEAEKRRILVLLMEVNKVGAISISA